MAKSKAHYLCVECGAVQTRWMGKCPDCGAWDALERHEVPRGMGAAGGGEGADGAAAAPAWSVEAASPAGAVPLAAVEAASVERLASGIGELDRVLGGGLVPGSVALLGGDPGIGKSTLLLQAAAALAGDGKRVLYVTSEESAYQTRLRAERLLGGGLDAAGELFVLSDTSLERIAHQAQGVRPHVLVLDSIQMVHSTELDAAAGTPTQIRTCGTALVHLAKTTGTAIVLVGHITKDGQLAGPKLLEHVVDVVLRFEGDRHHAHRIVRAVKNRFGTTLEVGLFEMTGRGLAEVHELDRALDPSAAPPPGAIVCPVVHGSRALLVEIQALTATGFLGGAKRRASGLDVNRVAMLIAVLEQHAGLRLADQDIFASVVGGLRVVEPAADLALCLAIAGAFLRRALPAGVVAVGEVGLGGEIRSVAQLETRVRAARRLGYRVLSATASPGDAHVIPVTSIGEALGRLEPASRSSQRATGTSETVHL